MTKLFSIRDVARRLGVAAHQIGYAHVQGKLAEPKLWVAGKRVYTAADLRRVAAYFGVDLAGGPGRRAQMDGERVAREAVAYLATHDLVFDWRFFEDDPPTEEIQRLVTPYVVGMAKEYAEVASRYIMWSLMQDWVFGTGRPPEISGADEEGGK